MKDKKIIWLHGRPERTEIINVSDYINLRIALNTSKTIDEFIKKV